MEPLSIVAIVILLILIYFALNSNDKFKSIIIILAGAAVLGLFLFNGKRFSSSKNEKIQELEKNINAQLNSPVMGSMQPEAFNRIVANYVDESADSILKDTREGYKTAIEEKLISMGNYIRKLNEFRPQDLTPEQTKIVNIRKNDMDKLYKKYNSTFMMAKEYEELYAEDAYKKSWGSYLGYTVKDYLDNPNIYTTYKNIYNKLCEEIPEYFIPQFTSTKKDETGNNLAVSIEKIDLNDNLVEELSWELLTAP